MRLPGRCLLLLGLMAAWAGAQASVCHPGRHLGPAQKGRCEEKREPAGQRPRLVVFLRPGPPLQVRVCRRSGGRLRAVAPRLSYRHQGKMASAADIDEDGRLDLLVLVHKKTRHDPQPGWRPFVYTLREGRWVPKWLGSRVGRPLEEAAFVQAPEGPRLLTIERFAPEQSVLTLYHWRGFGFWGEWTGEPTGPLRGLQVSDDDGDGVDEVSAIDPGGRRRCLEFRDGGCFEIQSGGTDP